MEQAVMEYLANALWQLPLLAAGAWLLLRLIKPGPAVQHRVWLAVLVVGLLLPLYGCAGVELTSCHEAMIPQTGKPPSTPSGGGTFSGRGFDAMGQPGGLILIPRTDGGVPVFSTVAHAVRVRKVHVNAVVVRWIEGLYLLVALIGLGRLALAWQAARRLVRESREITLTDRARTAVLECSRRFGVRVPEVRESGEIQGPVVVGAMKPVLLWPENFVNRAEDEVMAALCHEMAHIRRGDYLMNLLCEGAAVPLKWHPAIYGVERRIRSTREMVCDAMAAEAMESEMVYAKCLLRLAQSMILGSGEQMAESAAAGLFNGNALEERVMRLMQGEIAMSLRARAARGVAGAAAVMSAVALAAMFHVVPAMAKTSAVQTAAQADTPAATQTAPVPPTSPAPAPAADAAPAPAPAAPVVAPAPPPASAPTPTVAPVPPVPAVPAVAPVLPVAPVPPVAPPVPAVHVCGRGAHGHMTAWVDGQERELTPEEQRKVEIQLEKAKQQIAAATARINSPEFRKQIADAQKQAAATAVKINSGEFQKQMAEAQKRIDAETARINSPEFKRQMEEARLKGMESVRKMNSAELQKQMAEAQKEIAATKVKLDSPEFKKEIEDAQKQAAEAAAKVNSGEIQKQMADAQRQVDDAMKKMKSGQNDAK